ncbi:2-amino-4-hydroxy-6-hydroxymethyldihydropteridine diphosphokinase, partial [Myxococcota bacterium]
MNMPGSLGCEFSSGLDESRDYVVGLGANLGDPVAAFRQALLGMASLGVLRAVSSLYDSEPVGGPSQPRYLNAAVRL